MLTYINIKNFALIEELELDLQSELTVLTGETGAGKSIIIDTLELALGARADASLIRHGADRCEITTIFDLTNIPKALQWLIAQELDSENECIVRRVITNDGRSKSSINGYPCTQQILRNLSELLIAIHGQHENQALLNTEHQRDLVDAFADSKNLSAQVKEIYGRWLQIKKELLEMQNLADDYPKKVEFINYQLKELEGLDLSEDALKKLHEEHRRLSNIEQTSANVSMALGLLADNEVASVLSGLHSAKNLLDDGNASECLQNAVVQIEEAVSELRRAVDRTELDEERKVQVEQLLTNIHDLARKHHVVPEELLKIRTSLQDQLKSFTNVNEQLQKLEVEVDSLEKEYTACANTLSAKRKTAAAKLNSLVTEKLQLLGMEGGKFAATIISNQTFSAGGLERVEFLVSANPGQPPQSLNKVASGGELSRISLAIQVITAEKDVTPALIFDEIDTGIGGKTAEIVGQLLRKLADNAQVLCVTHLPQVAVQGHHHLQVTKTSDNNNTHISVTNLGKKERLEEVARMLGGVKITQQTLAHAEEMLREVI